MDPNDVYMDVFGLTVEDLFRDYFDYACKMVTYDMDAIRSYGANNIGDYTYKYVDTEDGKVQVAYASCPQSTGFNVIPLQVPSAGTTVTVKFTALQASGLPLLADGGLFVFEHGKQYDFSANPLFREHRAYGSVNFSIFKREGLEQEQEEEN